MELDKFKLSGITEKQFLKWCARYKKAPYSTNVKKIFFNKLQNKEIFKNYRGELINKEGKND